MFRLHPIPNLSMVPSQLLAVLLESGGNLPTINTYTFPTLADGAGQVTYSIPYATAPQFLRCVLLCQTQDYLNPGDEMDIAQVFDETGNTVGLEDQIGNPALNGDGSGNVLLLPAGGPVFGVGWYSGRICASYSGVPAVGGVAYGAGKSGWVPGLQGNPLQGIIFPVGGSSSQSNNYYLPGFQSFSNFALKIYYF